MGVMRWSLLVGLAACYTPAIHPGSPCDDDHPCPRDLVCSPATLTCERSAADPELPDAAIDAVRIDGCTPSFDICGDGLDQDCDGADVACAANDAPADAIDVTAGGVFTADLLRATDLAPQVGCDDRGGVEVFYEVTLAKAEVYYLDTLGSTFDSVVRAYPGKRCTQLGTGTGGTCNDDACAGAASQLAVSLPSGTSCIVVDRADMPTAANLALRVIPGGRDGLALGPNVTGNTCTATNVWDPPSACAEPGAKDRGYFFTVCPDQDTTVDAKTCASTTSYDFDTVLYVQRAGSTTVLRCNDDDDTCPVRTNRTDGHPDGSILNRTVSSVTGNLFWLVIDGYDAGACGNYTLTNTITRP